MDEQRIERDVEATLTSLDAVGRCGAPPDFVARVMKLVSPPEADSRAGVGGWPDWWPDLALAMVVLIVLLDGAAIVWSLQSPSRDVSRQTLVELTRHSLWADDTSFLSELR